MDDYNYPDIWWENNTEVHKSYLKFLECVEDWFLQEMLDMPTRNSILLDSLLTYWENLLDNITTNANLSYRDDNIVEFKICRAHWRPVVEQRPWIFGLINLVAFCDKVTISVDKGRATDVISLDFIRPLILSPETFCPLNWKDMGLVDTLLNG